MFDPSFGGQVSGGDLVKWLLKVVHTSDTALAKDGRETTLREPSKDMSPTKETARESTKESTS